MTADFSIDLKFVMKVILLHKTNTAGQSIRMCSKEIEANLSTYVFSKARSFCSCSALETAAGWS